MAANRMAIATLMTTDGHTIILIRERLLVGMGARWEIHMDGLKINVYEFKTESEAKKAFADVVQQWADE